MLKHTNRINEKVCCSASCQQTTALGAFLAGHFSFFFFGEATLSMHGFNGITSEVAGK